MSQGTLPVLPVSDVDAVVDSYVDRLGFDEDFRFPGEDGVTANAQVRRGPQRRRRPQVLGTYNYSN